MLLLENGKLTADVYRSVVTKFLALVNQRTNMPVNTTYAIRKEHLDLIHYEADMIWSQQTQNTAEDHHHAAEPIIATTESTVTANHVHHKNDNSIFKGRLADAFFVLSDLKVPFPIEGSV